VSRCAEWVGALLLRGMWWPYGDWEGRPEEWDVVSRGGAGHRDAAWASVASLELASAAVHEKPAAGAKPTRPVTGGAGENPDPVVGGQMRVWQAWIRAWAGSWQIFFEFLRKKGLGAATGTLG
jgi:hypothetical protein